MTATESQMSIQQVSDRLGLPKSTLRFWEKEFHKYIQPTRTAGGQRRYSEHDLEVIASISQHKKKGFSLTQIKALFEKSSQCQKKAKPIDIDQLANKISETVRQEIYNYFEKGLHNVRKPSGNEGGTS